MTFNVSANLNSFNYSKDFNEDYSSHKIYDRLIELAETFESNGYSDAVQKINEEPYSLVA